MGRKYVVTAGNQVVYTGADGVMVAAVVARAVTLTTENLKAVGEYIHKEWIKEAQTSTKFVPPKQSYHAWRDVDYRADYIRGIERPVVAGGSLDIQMRDMKALKVELGWAPPQTGSERDGLGMWDGEKHDLRPWLFSFGTIHTVDGKRYRNLRFIGPNKDTQVAALMSTVMGQFDADARYSSNPAAMAKLRERYERDQRAQAEHAYANALSTSRRANGKWTMREAQLSHVQAAMHNHVNWLYDKARPMHSTDENDRRWFEHVDSDFVRAHAKAPGTKFKTFRTVFEDTTRQTFSDSFYSAGIKPVGLITGKDAPVAKKLRDAIRNVLSNKQPDGTTNGH